LLSRANSRRSPCWLTYIHGPTGSGKSHLANIVIERFADGHPEKERCIVAARDLGKWVAGQVSDEQNLKRVVRRARLLVVEDFQHLPPSSDAAIVALLDARESRRLRTLITATVGPMVLPGLSTRLVNRLASGLVVRLKPLTLTSLKKLARFWRVEHDMRLDPDVLDWLVNRPRTTPRSLSGDLARLQQLSHERALPLDMPTATRLLHENAASNVSPIEPVANAVASWFHLGPDDLRSRERRPSLLWPRQVAMYVVRRETRMSLASIGAYFGRCDHTTVMHALRKVEARMAGDPDVAQAIEEIVDGFS
jgi:chromosomal replication initiator protein